MPRPQRWPTTWSGSFARSRWPSGRRACSNASPSGRRRRPALACRLAGLGIFYLVELANYHFGVVDWAFHLKMTLLAGAWVAISFVCDWLVDRPRLTRSGAVRLGHVRRADSPGGPFRGRRRDERPDRRLSRVDRRIGPMVSRAFRRFHDGPVAIVLWNFGARFLLSADWLQEHFDTSPTRHILFALSLVVLGAIVGWLVHRLRTLSKFYGRQLP